MSKDNPILAAIHHRTSVRMFDGRPVARELIETILAAAMAAPSALNVQPWRFMVVTERETLNELAKVLPNAQMLRTAPLAILVAADVVVSEAALPGLDYWIQDCAAATQNLLLAAEAVGLGAVWLGVKPVADRIVNVKRILALPESIEPLNLVAVGHPAKPNPPKDKFDADKIHWEKW